MCIFHVVDKPFLNLNHEYTSLVEFDYARPHVNTASRYNIVQFSKDH